MSTWLLALPASLIALLLALWWFRQPGLLLQIVSIRDQLLRWRQASDDAERQALIQRLGRTLLWVSARNLFGLALIALPLLIPWLWIGRGSPQANTYWQACTIIGFLFALGCWQSQKKSATEGYNWLSRGLHALALGPDPVRQASFEAECAHALRRSAADRVAAGNGAVYICGLARSGTSVLLQVLDRCPQLVSLHYRDMPFVLAPNLWRSLVGRGRANQLREREHRDGLAFGFDVAESFEEVFWRTFSPAIYVGTTLGADTPSPEVLAKFADYRALVANPRQTGNTPTRRYLSKNNNNLLRLSSLCTDPTAQVLVPYRHPLQVAASLHRQHRHFCERQREDAFARRYMGWLAHHEFGLDHRPFDFVKTRMSPGLTPASPDYWLEYWLHLHEHLLEQGSLPLKLLQHEALRQYPAESLDRLAVHLTLPSDILRRETDRLRPVTASENTDDRPEYATTLITRALAVYTRLQADPRNLFPSLTAIPLPISP